jgi:UDP-N-acetylglucosamine--N-acetylmuramyl-(pentapeptide) pyrophosphoryl-undecaprenol N-acetylglucosamine transferase
MRVVIGSGGTAGHVLPAVAVASRLRDRFAAEVVFVGRTGGREAELVPRAGFPLETVEALPLLRKPSLRTLQAPAVVLRAARRAREIVRGADVVIGMGGYVSGPVALAGRRERVPLVLHEQNAVPGLANRLASRWARIVALSFREAADRFPRRVRTVVTGNPVRAAVSRVADERDALAHEAHRELRLDARRRTVVLFGGSQGALRLNQAGVELAAALSDRGDLQLMLLTGPSHHQDVRRRLPSRTELLVRTSPFLERMELAYAVADLVVSRAGATTVAEIAVCGLPAVLVPYPYATGGHQEANARALERAGGATVVLDQAATGEGLSRRIEALLDDAGRLLSMARASRRFGRPDAADALADTAVASAGAG